MTEPNGSPRDAKTGLLEDLSIHHVLLITLTVVGVALGFLLLFRFYMAVFLFFVAIALKVALDPVVAWLFRHGVRKQLGALILYLLILLIIAALLWFIAPLLIEQGLALMEHVPDYYARARGELLRSPVGLVRGLARTLPSILSLPTLASTAIATNAVPAQAVAVSPWTWAGEALRWIGAFLLVLVLAYYWMLEGDLILRNLTFQVEPGRREALRELIRESEAKVGGFVRGQAILCLIVGGASMSAYFLLGVPNALLLGLIMGIFEAVPILGPALGAAPAIVMTLADAPDKVVWVIVVVIAIQVTENNLLVPQIMDESVGVNPVTSLLAIAGFGALFGAPGAILAIPMAAILQILLNRILFDAPVIDETAKRVPVAGVVGRDRIGILRVQARDLIQAAHKQVRAEYGNPVEEEEAIESADEIEAIATALDGYLAARESSA